MADQQHYGGDAQAYQQPQQPYQQQPQQQPYQQPQQVPQQQAPQQYAQPHQGAPPQQGATVTSGHQGQPAAAHGGSGSGAVDDKDVKEWTDRLNVVLAKPSEVVNSKSPESAQPWHNSLFGCFEPIDLCLITWCIPCITFGKTHHRLRKHGSLEGYEPVNASCLMFLASGCIGCYWVPLAMQRSDIREKFHLQGDCVTDIALACCCGLCDLIQQEKESEVHVQRNPGYQGVGGAHQGAGQQLQSQPGHQQQYKAEGGMSYPAAQPYQQGHPTQ